MDAIDCSKPHAYGCQLQPKAAVAAAEDDDENAIIQLRERLRRCNTTAVLLLVWNLTMRLCVCVFTAQSED